MNAIIQHTDVGAYALGLLEEPDRRAFESHLTVCPACREELGALRGLAASLDGLPPIASDGSSGGALGVWGSAPGEDADPAPPVRPDPAVVTDLLLRRRRLDRRRRMSQALVGVAAGLVLMGGAAGLGVTVGADREETPPVVESGVEALFRNGRPVAATDAGTGVSGQVATERKQWGSLVGLRLSRVRGPLECELVAVDRTGRAHTVAGWAVPPKGYGFPGSPPALTLQGGTALSPGEITRFEVRTIGSDRTLLTVPNT
ncbi:anti-sigma factor [Actinomadura rugatobispora]|uniref:Anti-sigma factor family protein n=1 Tax=Actinomadura rugatobispora TaxID=1994 RepID=A0ABW0ZWW2_9ACTN|nr:zf-HC2 domain-containing protein [Actinomadura rugatobispora]